jgi:hypothetical protein
MFPTPSGEHLARRQELVKTGSVLMESRSHAERPFAINGTRKRVDIESSILFDERRVEHRAI